MSVKIDPSGRRSIQVEVEVPGTPEQVWEAIATGPGVSSWFVPTEIDGSAGGNMVCHFAPGMDSKATITSWEHSLADFRNREFHGHARAFSNFALGLDGASIGFDQSFGNR